MATATTHKPLTGRRKEAVARVRLVPGTGNVSVNDRSISDYLKRDSLVLIVLASCASRAFAARACGSTAANAAFLRANSRERPVTGNRHPPVVEQAFDHPSRAFRISASCRASSDMPISPPRPTCTPT